MIKILLYISTYLILIMLNTHKILEFDRIMSAVRYLRANSFPKANRKGITNCCRFKDGKTSEYGFRWEYKDKSILIKERTFGYNFDWTLKYIDLIIKELNNI